MSHLKTASLYTSGTKKPKKGLLPKHSFGNSPLIYFVIETLMLYSSLDNRISCCSKFCKLSSVSAKQVFIVSASPVWMGFYQSSLHGCGVFREYPCQCKTLQRLVITEYYNLQNHCLEGQALVLWTEENLLLPRLLT